MAANKTTIELPNKVIKANWRDDIDLDYATQDNIKKAKRGKITFLAYNNEKDYVAPKKVDRETIKKIKGLKRRVGAKTFFFATADKLAA